MGRDTARSYGGIQPWSVVMHFAPWRSAAKALLEGSIELQAVVRRRRELLSLSLFASSGWGCCCRIGHLFVVLQGA